MKYRTIFLLTAGIAALGLGGCSWWNGLNMRSQSPEEPKPEEPQTELVGDFAVPTGMQPARVEAIGLVTGLRGTGSDPIPSPQRAALLDEMKTRDVTNPNALLASGNVAMVMIQGVLRPGIQKGDRFDIDIRVPSQSDTTSLRGGYLLLTHLCETAVMPDRVHKGNLLALAEGPVMVDPAADAKNDRVSLCRGRVLGGGLVLKSRPLALVLTPDCKDVRNASRVAIAVNRRFHTYLNGRKEGMAKAISDELVELKLHPRYKDNIARYVQVCLALPMSESAPERMKRVLALKELLLDPATSADAAIQLEALATEGVDPLLNALESSDPEVRFYAAEALAYLDHREAAEPLGQIARDQPAFRVFAMTALSAMQDFAAADQLRALLSAPSVETRYGAFRSLWTMNANDPLLKDEFIGGQFHYHVLDVPGQPMIHVTRNRLAEVVVFGRDQRFLTPLMVNAGNEITLVSQGGDEITLSKYSVTEGDQKRIVSTKVDDVLRAVVDLGGTYPDVVQALQEARNIGALASRFEVDALPEAGRTYDRVADNADNAGGSEDAVAAIAAEDEPIKRAIAPRSPAPDLFQQNAIGGSKLKGGDLSDEDSGDEGDSDENAKTKKGFFAKMFGR